MMDKVVAPEIQSLSLSKTMQNAILEINRKHVKNMSKLNNQTLNAKNGFTIPSLQLMTTYDKIVNLLSGLL